MLRLPTRNFIVSSSRPQQLSSQLRWFAGFRKRARLRKRKKKEAATPETSSATTEACDGAIQSASLPKTSFANFMRPVRFRHDGSSYSNEQLKYVALRLPLWIALAGLCYFELTPFGTIRVYGPSMIPTMEPDKSDIWLISRWRQWIGMADYNRQDLIGFSHPSHPEHVSCKRIIGVAGDGVRRYGQFVHLYAPVDPTEYGMNWPDNDNGAYSWMDRNWDTSTKLPSGQEESEREIVVPEGHVWVEADCPNLGIDSRHFGPLPIEFVRGKVVARLWPLWRQNKETQYSIRPHPVPLDADTLAQYNVHKIPKSDLLP